VLNIGLFEIECYHCWPGPDAVYADAGVMLARLLEGGGGRRKVVEAWKHGKAVLGTTKGLESLDAPPGACSRADSSEAFGGMRAALMGDNVRRKALGQAAVEFVRGRLSYRVMERELRRAAVAARMPQRVGR
jgi:hypothetical protein